MVKGAFLSPPTPFFFFFFLAGRSKENPELPVHLSVRPARAGPAALQPLLSLSARPPLAPPAALGGSARSLRRGWQPPAPFSQLVHPLPTIPSSTVAGDLVLIVLEVELVVVGELGESGESPKARSSALPPPAPFPGSPRTPSVPL